MPFTDYSMTNPFFFEALFLLDYVPAPNIEEIYRLHNKVKTGLIFPPIELPQYIVVPPTDCEMKDIIGYHNKHLTGKISNYTAFF
jgi:hypothetical protein